MTDKALEAALLPCPFCGGMDIQPSSSMSRTHVRCRQCNSQSPSVWHGGPTDDRATLNRCEAEAIAAWNRRAPLSALPGEAEVVGWAYRGPRGGLIVTEEKPEHAPEAVPLVTLASLQAMQARAEKAEIENDRLIADAQAAWSKHGGTEIALGQWKARAEKAERELSNMLQGVSDEES